MLKLLAAGSLIFVLGACAGSTSDLDIETSSETSEEASDRKNAAGADANSTDGSLDRLPSVPESIVDSPVGMRDCATTQYVSQPLTHSENEPVFAPFNFRPDAVTVFADTVAVETANYTFYYCSDDKNWVALSNDAELKSPEDRWYDLGDIANPAYQSIEVNGEVYEYRTRLEADWLNKQAGTAEGAEYSDLQAAEASEDASYEDASYEDTVYFDLKLPNGDEINRELYAASDLRAAKLGASLGVPDVSGAAVADGKLWFATTASQGEGDSGFASLLNYDLETETLSVEQPDELQGDQITDMVATEKDGEVTLWLGTQRMGEGVPFYPASGLVAYRPESGRLKAHTITNSPMVGAIPYALAVENELLWVATGDGPCRVKWQRIDKAKSWTCWRIAPVAQVPKTGVAVFPSFLATESEAQLTDQEVEVLWVAASYDSGQNETSSAESTRYEVVYEPGFEAMLSQGGYRVADAAAKRAAKGESIFWPGRQWHWAGDRFRRGLDEVGLNFVGGGPYGLVSSTTGNGLRFDHKAIRGAFDLLELTPEGTKVKYYSGWVDADALEVHPRLKLAAQPRRMKPNPLTKMASDLPNSGP